MGYQESGEFDKKKRRIWRFDEISPERLRFEGASERGGYQESGEFDKKKRRIWRFDEISPERLRFEGASERGGYQESGEFDENGEFGEIGDLTKSRQKDLDLRQRTKEAV